MKRFWTVVNTVLTGMVLWGAHTYAAEVTPWNGTTQSPQTSGQTYIVRTAEELAWIAAESQSNDFSGKTVRLEADIDLGGTQETPYNWTPIGNDSHPFNGELDGANHVVYNLYLLSSLYPKGAGLFAETGPQAVIHNLGIGQGQIMTDATHNVGAFAGIHRGRLHHCFNMMQLIVHGGNNVGGLAGVNSGEITYCYNAGIITDAGSYVGGLAGTNEATARLSHCYNMGYCKGSDHVGALFGRNDAPEEQLTNVVFDQQLTLVYATGNGANDKILKDNTKYAIEKSAVFTSNQSPFYEDPEKEWHYESAGVWSHPQLLCFKDHPASHVSVKAIWLDTENRPIMRAEGVGAPTESNEPRGAFKLEQMNHSVYGKGNWSSPSPDVIYINKPTDELATVHRPCGNQEVILSVSYDRFVKQIYTVVKGYETFDAGVLSGHASVCWMADDAGFKDSNKEGKEANGGKDDDQKNERNSYQYRLIRDTVITEADGSKTYLPMDTFRMCQEEYKSWPMPTDVPGEYAFRRDVHDVQCKTEWTRSQGRLFLTVRKEFDPGELYEKADTLYGVLPMTTTIRSRVDASGGGEQFSYKWSVKRSEWVVDSLAWIPMPDDSRNPLYINGELVETPSLTYTFDKPGTYTFTRSVKEESCKSDMLNSRHPHVVVVYEAINPGAIESFVRQLCTAVCTDTIQEKDTVSGGDGLYTYRWLCNGEPLPDSDTTIMEIERVHMSAGNTYVFVRQVKDNTGLTDWVTSRGKVTVSVYGDYSAGGIVPADQQVCTGAAVPGDLDVHISESEPAHGDEGSEFAYCWLLYRGSPEGTPIDTLPYNSPTLNATIPLRAYGLQVPVTLCLRRAVQNVLCQSEWRVSDNTVSWRYGRAEQRTDTLSICAGDLPYDYVYTYTDGTKRTFRFTADGQQQTVEDETDEGCPLDVRLVGVTVPVPEVEVQPVVSVCQTADNLKIAYRVVGGAPDRFDLTFPASAHEAGFRDSLHALMPDTDCITIPLPNRVPLGPQSLTIVFYTDSPLPESCRRTRPHTLSFSIDLDGYVRRKGEDILFVDNSGRHTEHGLTFVSYRWFRDGVLLSGETDQFIHEYPSLDGVYQVEMTTEDGTVYRSCLYTMRPGQTEGTEAPASGTAFRKELHNGRLVLVAGSKRYTILGQTIH